MQREEWKDVVCFEGLYQISSIGNVRNRHEKNIYPSVGSRPQFYYLSKNGKRYKMQTRDMIAAAFLDRPSGATALINVDGSIDRNTVDNLKWI